MAKVTVPAIAAGAAMGAASLALAAAVHALSGGGSGFADGAAMLAVTLAVLATAGAAWWLLRKRVTDPLSRVRAALLERIQGNQTALAPVESVDEVGQMASSVNEVIAAAFSRDAYVNGILQTAADGIITIDELGIIELYNRAAETMFGYGFEEAVGSHIGKLLPSYEKLPINPLGMDDVGFRDEDEPARRYEAEGKHQSARLIPLSVTIGNLPSDEGTRYVLVLRDVTARKEVEEALRQARDTAEAVSRTKSEFLANVSHEIRTPINGIIGMTELALDSDLTAEQRQYMDAVKISGDSLLEMINDILDSSKIEAGHLELESIDFTLGQCLDNALLPLSVRARQKGLELTSEIDSDVPNLLRGDPTRLRQIVVNLVSNAIKFTRDGSVTLRVASETQSPERIELHCSVTDTGIGIPAEQQGRIFESFTQADGSTTRKFGGTGLGLSICTQLVGLMEGEIWVESEEGLGSTFHFTAVMAPGAEPAASQTDVGSALEGVQALLIRLGEGGRRGLLNDLSEWGVDVEAVNSISEAVAILGAHGERNIRLIAVDAVAADGFGAVESLREHLHGDVAVALLARNGQRGDGRRCREVGVGAYLSESSSRTDVFDALNMLCSDSDEEALVTRHLLRERRKALHILLAEDNVVNQKLAVSLLERAGHRVHVVGDGRQALAQLEEGDIDVVLMDVQMPELDGLETTREIRRREAAGELEGHVPIIAMTAHVLKEDRERCLEAGMDEYLSKPLQREKLLRLIDRMGQDAPDRLREFRESQGLGKVAAEPSGEASADPEISGFDYTQALSQMGDDADLLREVADVFLDDIPRQLQEIRSAVEAGDAEQLQRTAHSLKGAVSNFAAELTREAAYDLELLGKGGNLAGATGALSVLEGRLARLERDLRGF